MFPLGCLPLWGKEGVILITGREYERIIGEKQDFYRAVKTIFFKEPERVESRLHGMHPIPH